ncbi:Uncharacterised protein [Mycobacteroides abscessus subsp. abscessus]|nr:Uncharacterised protein [Mycobacteroides abscessus subsp. abscessus]
MRQVLDEVVAERVRQHDKWGEQNHPDGTKLRYERHAILAKALVERHAANGTITYADILWEEVTEAFAETDKARLRAELIQVAAVAVAWVEKIDRGF